MSFAAVEAMQGFFDHPSVGLLSRSVEPVADPFIASATKRGT
jgi:hypothetical protein